jgi:hypothetical protein
MCEKNGLANKPREKKRREPAGLASRVRPDFGPWPVGNRKSFQNFKSVFEFHVVLNSKKIRILHEF